MSSARTKRTRRLREPARRQAPHVVDPPPAALRRKRKRSKKRKPAAAGTGERIDRELTTGFTTGLRLPVDHRLPPTTRAGRSLMDNLGKAYGQLPTVSTPFQLQRIGSLYPDGSFFLEREKREILFPSIGSPLRYQQSPYRGAYIINRFFLGKFA